MSGLDRGPLTTVTLFGFGEGQRVWALSRMALARPALARTAGLRFWKLLGSGRGGGFDPRPDWSRFGLLAVWDADADADGFFARGALFAEYRARAAEVWTARLRTLAAHGAWSGANPFLPAAPGCTREGPVAVLTRASIRAASAPAFWRAAPAANRALDGAAGLIAAAGVGEAPLVRQATFSLWRSEADVRAFAYGHAAHREVIRRARGERWYSEELFARFAPVGSEGAWDGRDPLAGCAA